MFFRVVFHHIFKFRHQRCSLRCPTENHINGKENVHHNLSKMVESSVAFPWFFFCGAWLFFWGGKKNWYFWEAPRAHAVVCMFKNRLQNGKDVIQIPKHTCRSTKTKSGLSPRFFTICSASRRRHGTEHRWRVVSIKIGIFADLCPLVVIEYGLFFLT